MKTLGCNGWFPGLTLATALVCLAPPSARAATNWWDGDGLQSNRWMLTTSWATAEDGSGTPGAQPGASDVVVFNATPFNTSNVWISIDSAKSIGGLVFNNAGTTWIGTEGANRAMTIGADGIRINSGAGTVNFGQGANNWRITFTLGASQSWINDSANAMVFAGRSTLTMAGYTLTLGGSGDMSYSATMQSTGSGAVTKEGSGVLTLSGTNTYSGPFTLNAGRVRLAGAQGNLGAGTVVLNAGTLSGNNATTARTLVNAFTLGGNVALGHATDSALLTLSGAGTLTGNRSVTVDSTVVISGAIGDSGGNYMLTKAGTGMLTLSGANSYGGGTQVDAGTLHLANLAALPFSGTVSVGAGATIALAVNDADPLTYWTTAEIDALWANSLFGFNLNADALVGIDTSPGDVVYASSLGSTRGLVKIGTNSLTLSGASTFSGGVDVRNGTLAAGSDGALGTGTLTLRAGAALTNTADRSLDNAVTLVGNTAIGVAAGTTMTISNAVDGSGGASLMKTGDGTLVLESPIALSGIFTNLGGTIVLNSPGTNGFAGELRLAVGAGSVSTFIQNDGFVDGSGNNGTLLGNGTGASGTYIMNGGSLLAHPSTANRGVMLGVNAGTTGRFEMAGGSVTGRLLEVSRSSATGPQSAGYFIQSGGVVGFVSMTLAGGSASGSSNSFALLAISNGTFWSSGFGGFASGNDSTGLVYFGQGAQVTLPAFPTARGTNAYAEVTFDGGTLAPLAASTAYMTNVTKVFLTDNGATLDVPLGRNITVGQSLEDASGDNGVLRKTGAGVLTLAGANTYSGGSIVSNGTLALATAAAKPGTGTINVLADGALGLRIGGAGFFTTTDVDNLWANTLAGVTMDAAARVGIDTTEGDLTYGTAQSTRGLVKLGANTLTLTGDNTYAGGTEIHNGILQIGNGGTSGAIGSGNVINNGSLVIYRSDAVAIPGDISGTGTLTNRGTGTTALSGSNTFTGAMIVERGAVDLTGSLLGGIGTTYSIGTDATTPGSFTIAGDVLVNNLYVADRVAGATGFVTQTAGTVIITNSLQLARQAASLADPTVYGQYTLGGGSLYVGGTFFLAPYTNGVGVFRMTDGVMTAATVQIGRDSTSISNTTGRFIQSGGTSWVGKVSIADSADTYGLLAVTSGVFIADVNDGYAGKVNSTGEVYFGQGSQVTYPFFGTVRGAGSITTVKLDGTRLTPSAASTAYMTNLTAVTITDNGVTLDVPTGRDITIGQGLQNDGASTGFLVKSGAGALALQGNNTFSGGITLNEGRLDLNSPTALGAAAGVFTIASNGVTIGTSGANTTTNTIANNNPMVWNGDFSYTGAGARSLNLGSGSVTLGGDRTVSVLNNTLIVEGILDDGANDYDLTKAGTGRLTLTAASTFSGALAVLGGTLELSGGGQLANVPGILISNLGSLALSNAGTVLGNRLPDAAPIGMAGGTLAWTHDAAAATAYSETLGALSLTGGTNHIVASQAAADGTAALTFASLARSGGARAVVEGTDLGLDDRNRVFFTAAPATLDGLLPWMLLRTGTGGVGADWDLAEYDATAGLRAPAYVNDETTWAAGLVARPTADQTLTTQRTLTALVLDDGIDLAGPAADRNLNLDASPAAALILQTGGISSITNAGNPGYNILFGANEGVFNTIGTLWITRGNDNNATIRGTNGFLKIGPGTLILQSASQANNATALNNMRGIFSIQEGTLELRRPDAAGGAVLELNGGTLMLATNASAVFTSQDATPTNTPLVVSQSGTVLVSRVSAGGGVTHTLGNLTLKNGVQMTLDYGANFNNDQTYGLRFDTMSLLGDATLKIVNGPGNGDGVLYATNVTDNGGGFSLNVFGNSAIRSELRVHGTLSISNLVVGNPAANGAVVRTADGFANVLGNILVQQGTLASGTDVVRELGDGPGQVRYVGTTTAGISAGGAPASFAFTQGGVTGMLAWGAPNFEISVLQMNEDDAGAEVTLLNALDLNSGAGAVTRQITVDNNTAVIAGAITNTGSGTAGLLKAGGSTLWLTGPLGYNGTTRVNGGHLRVPDASSLPAGNLNLNPGNSTGSLETQGTFTRPLGDGDNQVQIVGTATGAGNSRPGFSAFGGDLTIDIGGNGTGTGPALVWNSAYFDPEAAVVTNGAFFLNSGVANGTLNLLNSIDLNGTGEAGVTDRRFEVNGSVAILHGAVANNGGTPIGLQKRGTGMLVLGANNTYDGGTYVQNGTLVVGAGGTAGTLGAGNVTNDAVLAFNRSNNYAVDQLIVGGGTVAQVGSGTLTLSANNSYTGPTVVSNGALRINGAHSGPGLITVAGGTLGGTGSVAGAMIVQGGATLAPGASPGVFTANGDVTLDSGSTFEVELNGLAVGTEYDRLAMGPGTALTLTNPTLLVQLGFSPALDDTFLIVAGFSSLSGTFNGLPDNATFTAGGTDFRIDYNSSDITLTVVPEPASLGVLGLLAMAALLRRRAR